MPQKNPDSVPTLNNPPQPVPTVNNSQETKQKASFNLRKLKLAVGVVLFLALLIGLGVGLVVVKLNQDIRNKADDGSSLITQGPGTSCIGDQVILDSNSDGIQNSNETGVSGVQVTLLSDTGNQLSSTATDNSGVYEFCGLASGNYQVNFSLPSGYSFSPVNQGSDANLDSDANPQTGLTSSIVLASNVNNKTIDALIHPLTNTPVSPTPSPSPTANTASSPSPTPSPTTSASPTPSPSPTASNSTTPSPSPTSNTGNNESNSEKNVASPPSDTDTQSNEESTNEVNLPTAGIATPTIAMLATGVGLIIFASLLLI